jgi:hypothetical protein
MWKQLQKSPVMSETNGMSVGDHPAPKRRKHKIKRQYENAEIGLTDALTELMFEHEMMQGEALKYLGL